MAKPGKVVSVDYRPGYASRGLGKCLAEQRCVATGDLIDGHPAKWYRNQSESEFPAFLPYTTAIRGSDATFDVIFVAGRFHIACLLEAHPFVAPGGTVYLDQAQRYLALHIARNQLATPRRALPHVQSSYAITPQGKKKLGKRNNAVILKYYDVVAMAKDVVALRPKELSPAAKEALAVDLAAARRGPC